MRDAIGLLGMRMIRMQRSVSPRAIEEMNPSQRVGLAFPIMGSDRIGPAGGDVDGIAIPDEGKGSDRR